MWNIRLIQCATEQIELRAFAGTVDAVQDDEFSAQAIENLP
jgi:hypothetical protein